MCPLGGRLWDGFSHGAFAKLVCHCWLIESEDGLILIDTGIARDPARRAHPMFDKLNRPFVDDGHCAVTQIERLGFSASDVRHIVMTHLDFDHAGGIIDFPNARLHVMESELVSAQRPRGFVGSRRYLNQQWARARDWQTYRTEGEPWFGFRAVRQLRGLPPEILLVPLRGHTEGHAGVAVKTDEDGWMLHAGDAYFYRGEMDVEAYRCTPGCRAYQRFMAVDNPQRLMNQSRLRDLVKTHSDEVRVCSSHDAIELMAYQMTESKAVRAHARRPNVGPQLEL